MKVFRLLILFFFISDVLIFSQISGNGTEGNPYTGDVVNNTTWTIDAIHGNTVYVGNLYIVEAFSLTISPGLIVIFNGNLVINGTLIIKPAAAATAGSIYNAGALKLESDYSGTASLIFNSYSGPGITQSQIYLSGGYTTNGGTDYYKWHYISNPTMDPIATSTFTANTLDLAQFIESNVTTDNLQGWVAADGYMYYSQLINPSLVFNQLLPGKGYNYYCSSDHTYLISGILNSQDVSVDLTCGTGDTNIHGYNLIGNPFPSCLDWDYLYNNDLIPNEVNDAIYFTVNDGFASYVGGIGQGGGTGTIPSNQGFFVKANSNVNSFTLPAAARTHNLDQSRYKGAFKTSKSRSIPIVRLKFENDKDSDDLVIRFDRKATPDFDKSFDAYKFNKKGGKIDIWSRTGNTDYSINGLPFPETSLEVPVGIFASSEGTYRISSNELTIPENYIATIEDITSHTSANFTKGDELVFYTNSGLIENRFVLTITNISTGTPPDILLPDRKFSIYAINGTINIIPLTEEIENNQGTISIFSLTGEKILQETGIEFRKGELHQIFIKPTHGLYLIEIKSRNTRYVQKLRLIR